MSRLRSFAIVSLLIAAAATSGQAAMSTTRPTTVPQLKSSATRGHDGQVYITDVAGKRVRLIGPHFMSDPDGHHLILNGKPERVDLH